jgi:predicted hydrocarbon binding protein
MLNSDLGAKQAPKLSRDEEKGWILEDGLRIISFRQNTFQIFLDSLVSIVGLKIGVALMHSMGNTVGHATMQYVRDEVRGDDDLGKVLDKVLLARGWGRCVDLSKKREGERAIYVFKLSDTPISQERKTTELTCHLIRGLLAGWVEAYHGRGGSESVEKECVAVGGEHCTFEVRLPVNAA